VETNPKASVPEAVTDDPPDEQTDEATDETTDEVRGYGGGSGWTTTKQAAKVLGVSRRSVQAYVRRGILEATEEGEGVNKTFLVSIDSLNALRDRRRREAGAAANFAGASAEAKQPANVYANTGEALRHAIERVEVRTAEATELRVRLEITEKAESTLRAELEEERRRREGAERERDELAAELAALKQARESAQTTAEAAGGVGESRPATKGAQEAKKFFAANKGRRHGADRPGRTLRASASGAFIYLPPRATAR
jgi:hypothetical protein